MLVGIVVTRHGAGNSLVVGIVVVIHIVHAVAIVVVLHIRMHVLLVMANMIGSVV